MRPETRLFGVEAALEKINILLLDGSEPVTALFESMLAQFGFTAFYRAHNGFDGLRIMRENRIDLIIADWELKIARPKPDLAEKKPAASDEIAPLTGIDFVKRLRRGSDSPNPHVPIIMLANDIDKRQALAAIDAGANEICAKPLNAREFFSKISAVIDAPRLFIAAKSYRGPCRRRAPHPSYGVKERRYREIHVVPAHLRRAGRKI